ncbi:hypothetical protein DVS28_a2933 [Euzebya pacifica]|uniref:Uncharacterized protein n=1 Tax=Euzebya pacifica TaxID=1608957 RepID=A0A346XZG5_9ACTN|nr:hypothetical protein [Euzebya pacifica]AXV07612.1 hypothetical protein DVS28_a2933 [Euzebya pacifica]
MSRSLHAPRRWTPCPYAPDHDPHGLCDHRSPCVVPPQDHPGGICPEQHLIAIREGDGLATRRTPHNYVRRWYAGRYSDYVRDDNRRVRRATRQELTRFLGPVDDAVDRWLDQATMPEQRDVSCDVC